MKIRLMVVATYIGLGVMLILAYGAYTDTRKALEAQWKIQQKTIETQRATIVQKELQMATWKTLYNDLYQDFDKVLSDEERIAIACGSQRQKHERFWKTYGKRTVVIE